MVSGIVGRSRSYTAIRKAVPMMQKILTHHVRIAPYIQFKAREETTLRRPWHRASQSVKNES